METFDIYVRAAHDGTLILGKQNLSSAVQSQLKSGFDGLVQLLGLEKAAEPHLLFLKSEDIGFRIRLMAGEKGLLESDEHATRVELLTNFFSALDIVGKAWRNGEQLQLRYETADRFELRKHYDTVTIMSPTAGKRAFSAFLKAFPYLTSSPTLLLTCLEQQHEIHVSKMPPSVPVAIPETFSCMIDSVQDSKQTITVIPIGIEGHESFRLTLPPSCRAIALRAQLDRQTVMVEAEIDDAGTKEVKGVLINVAPVDPLDDMTPDRDPPSKFMRRRR